MEDKEPDYRYTLANERTFLAYIRTALGLDAGGLAAAQFLQPTAIHIRLGIAVMLVVLGIVVSILSYQRWTATEQAMRRGLPLPRVHLPLVLGIGVLVVSIGALAVVLASH